MFRRTLSAICIPICLSSKAARPGMLRGELMVVQFHLPLICALILRFGEYTHCKLTK